MSNSCHIYGDHPAGNSGYDIDALTFTAVGNYNQPSGSPPLLDGHVVKNHQELGAAASIDNLAFKVYQTTDMDFIWNDRMSGCPRGIAVYRSRGHEGTYSLGDIAARTTTGKPTVGFVVKPLVDDALRAPEGFREVWNDKGTGSRLDVTLYQPFCPSGYVSLGHVAVQSHTEKPPGNAIRCVKSEYVTSGEWDFAWNDRGSKGPKACTVWEATAISGTNGQGVEAITASASYSDMPYAPKVLKADLVNFVAGKPVSRYEIQDVKYLVDDRQITNNEPDSLARTTVVNKGTSEQEATRIIEYSFTEVTSWESQIGLEVGVETTISAAIPFVAGSKVQMSVSSSFEQQWGGELEEETTDAIEVHITVQGKSSKMAEIVGKRYTIDIPYTATLITHYTDGTTGLRSDFEGTFHGVEVNGIHVVYHEDIPLLS